MLTHGLSVKGHTCNLECHLPVKVIYMYTCIKPNPRSGNCFGRHKSDLLSTSKEFTAVKLLFTRETFILTFTVVRGLRDRFESYYIIVKIS